MPRPLNSRLSTLDFQPNHLRVIDLLGADVPYILAQGIVFVLVLKVELVLRLLGRVFQASCHSRSHLSPIGAVLLLVVADRGGALTVGGGVIEFGCGSVCESDLVGFTDTSVDLIHREGIFYFCHSVRHWLALQAVGSALPRWMVTRLRRVYRRFTAVLPPSPTQSVLYLPMGDTTAALQPYPPCRRRG